MERENRLNIFDRIVGGFYELLDMTLYRSKTDNIGFGAKEHAVLLAWLVHSMYAQIICNHIWKLFFHKVVPFYLVIIIAVLLLVAHYIVYIRNKRLSEIISQKKSSNCNIAISIFIMVIYVAILIYLLIK